MAAPPAATAGGSGGSGVAPAAAFAPTNVPAAAAAPIPPRVSPAGSASSSPAGSLVGGLPSSFPGKSPPNLAQLGTALRLDATLHTRMHAARTDSKGAYIAPRCRPSALYGGPATAPARMPTPITIQSYPSSSEKTKVRQPPVAESAAVRLSNLVHSLLLAPTRRP